MAEERDGKPITPREESLTEKALQKPKQVDTSQLVELTAVEVTEDGNEKVLNFLLRELQNETDDAKRKQKLELIKDLKDLMYDVRKKEIELEKAANEVEQNAKDSKRIGVLNVAREVGVVVGILALFVILGISAYYTFAKGSNVGLFLTCMIIAIFAYGTFVSELNFSFGDLFKFEGKAKEDKEK